MERIIRLAIEGGWKPRGVDMTGWSSFTSMIRLVPIEEMLMDPELYKALGRQQGWKSNVDSFDGSANFEPGSFQYNNGVPEWKYHKARALAANNDGGSAEDYLNSIIK